MIVHEIFKDLSANYYSLDIAKFVFVNGLKNDLCIVIRRGFYVPCQVWVSISTNIWKQTKFEKIMWWVERNLLTKKKISFPFEAF